MLRRSTALFTATVAMGSTLATPAVAAQPRSGGPYPCYGVYYKPVHPVALSDENVYPTGYPWETEGVGPVTLSLSFSDSVANSWSGGLNVTAEAVTATVGFSVTKTNQVTVGATHAVPAGHKDLLYGYYVQNVTSYQVHKYSSCNGADLGSIGTGYAYRFVRTGWSWTRLY